MSFEWLENFQQNAKKADDYAEKTLAAYRLGMRAKGSIAGVTVTIDPKGCAACKKLKVNVVYHPDEAPRIPLEECDRRERCACVYRPVMTYQVESD